MMCPSEPSHVSGGISANRVSGHAVQNNVILQVFINGSVTANPADTDTRIVSSTLRGAALRFFPDQQRNFWCCPSGPHHTPTDSLPSLDSYDTARSGRSDDSETATIRPGLSYCNLETDEAIHQLPTDNLLSSHTPNPRVPPLTPTTMVPTTATTTTAATIVPVRCSSISEAVPSSKMLRWMTKLVNILLTAFSALAKCWTCQFFPGTP